MVSIKKIVGICALVIAIMVAVYVTYQIMSPPTANPDTYDQYMANAKMVSVSDLSLKYTNLTLPKWVPDGMVLTAAYDGPDGIITYSNTSVTDYRFANIGIEVTKSGSAPTVDQVKQVCSQANGTLVMVGDVPVALFPNAYNGQDASRSMYPTFPYCWFVYNGIYYQVSVKGLTATDLTHIVSSIIGANATIAATN